MASRGLWFSGSPEAANPSDPKSKPKPSAALPAPIQSRPARCPFLGGADWLNLAELGGLAPKPPNPGPHHQLLQSNRPAYHLLPSLHRGRFLAPSHPPPLSHPHSLLPSSSLALSRPRPRPACCSTATPACTLTTPPPPLHPLVLPWTLTRRITRFFPSAFLFLLFCYPPLLRGPPLLHCSFFKRYPAPALL